MKTTFLKPRWMPILAVGWLNLAGCSMLFKPAEVHGPPDFYKAAFNPEAPADNLASRESLEQALALLQRYYTRRPLSGPDRLGEHACSAADVRATLRILADLLQSHGLTEDFFTAVSRHCDAFVPAEAKVLATAYYTPVLHGARTPSKRYAYPVYRLPPELQTKNPRRPYYSRRQIDVQGALKSKGFELLWVDDPVELYFLQIEGSGMVRLENGDHLRLAYAGVNGHPCRMIGRLLRVEKRITGRRITVPAIKDYLRDNPREVARVLSSDPSYVFFQPARHAQTTGCYGLPLIPLRAFAADRRYYPPGIPAYVEMTIPEYKLPANGGPPRRTGFKKIRTLAFNLDTGGMIRGPARIDWYTGTGPLAEALAGDLAATARVCLLLKKKASGQAWESPGS